MEAIDSTLADIFQTPVRNNQIELPGLPPVTFSLDSSCKLELGFDGSCITLTLNEHDLKEDLRHKLHTALSLILSSEAKAFLASRNLSPPSDLGAPSVSKLPPPNSFPSRQPPPQNNLPGFEDEYELGRAPRNTVRPFLIGEDLYPPGIGKFPSMKPALIPDDPSPLPRPGMHPSGGDFVDTNIQNPGPRGSRFDPVGPPPPSSSHGFL